MENIIEVRQKNALKEAFEFIKKYNHIFIYLALLAIIIYSGIYLRTLDMPTLIDVSTGQPTLAQDLDPFLYLRWAKEIINHGTLPENDEMRYVPLGFSTTNELTLPAYTIAYMYKLGIFSSIELSAIYYPVIFFGLFLVAFFLFVRKVLSNNKYSNWMAVIATAIVSVIPGLLHRTLAGVPEKESAGLFFMFLALYFMACMFNRDKSWKAVLFGTLAGISTGFMGLYWGGVTFLFMVMPIAAMLIHFFSKIDFNDALAYAFWAIGTTAILETCTTRYGFLLLSPLAMGFAYFIGITLFIKPKKDNFLMKILYITGILVAISIVLVIINPHFSGKGIVEYVTQDIFNFITKPFITDRLTMTVAENQLAGTGIWFGSFGKPLCWAFLIGLAALLADAFKKREKNLFLLLAVVIFSIACSGSAIRLFYFVYPIVPIIVGFLFIKAFDFIADKNDIIKMLGWVIIGATLFAILTSINIYNSSSIQEATYSGTNYYSAQWQLAMSWVRENTPKDAVFAHWWDYGYWVQSIGERATVLDGGNVISYWDYLMGGLVLTGNINNETPAFDFLKTHKATYLLIDSSDIGKYTAYSTIGSDENYDKMSMIGTFVLDKSLSQEKRNETIEIYRGFSNLDEDMIFEGQIIPQNNAAIFGFNVPISTISYDNISAGDMKQPSLILGYQNRNIYIPIRCAYYNNKKYIWEGKAIEGCLYMISAIKSDGITQNGAGLWLSPRLMKSEMVHLYIINEQRPGFVKAHYEPNTIISEYNQNYKLNISDIAYHWQIGIIGPIKIWSIDYSAHPEAQEVPQYLNRTYPKKELWAVNQ